MKLKHEILVLGTEKAGKTQLINRFLDQPFEARYSPTQGVDSKKAEKGGRAFWFRDVSATTPCNLIGKPFNTAHEVYLVFDSSDPEGLKKLKAYLSTLNLSLADKKITLIGTHDDLEQKVSTEEIVAYARELNADYVPISSKQDNHPSITTLTNASMRITIAQKPPMTRRGSFDSTYDDHIERASTGSGNQSTLTAAALKRHQEQAASVSEEKRDTGLMRFDAAVKKGKSPEKKSLLASPTSHSNVDESERRPTKKRSSNYNPDAHLRNATSQLQGSQQRPKPSSTWCSFALRMAGMAMILAGIIGLIYIALIIGNILTLHSLITLTNHIVTGIGALVGASASTSIATFGNVCASAGVSTTTGASAIVTGISLGVGALGLCLFRAGKALQSDEPGSGASFEMQRR